MSRLAKNNTLVIVGDFNAKDPSWGYKTTDKKGTTVKEAADNINCQLLTDPEVPTRMGNSVQEDTSLTSPS